MTSGPLAPVAIDLERRRELRIRWSDGVSTRTPLPVLRKNCPCATCRALREAASANPLQVVQPAGRESDMVTAQGADLVGNYALRITWADGHNTGIFDYGLLRRLGEPGPAAAEPNSA